MQGSNGCRECSFLNPRFVRLYFGAYADENSEQNKERDENSPEQAVRSRNTEQRPTRQQSKSRRRFGKKFATIAIPSVNYPLGGNILNGGGR